MPAGPVAAETHPDEVAVIDMKRALEEPELKIQVIDVREPDEYEIARIPGVTLIPLKNLPQRFTQLDPNQTIYLHCKGGVRSMNAVKFLQEHGFKHVKSVRGGITAWSEQIDRSVPKY
jgi:sulfur-carrier protein adenylyltransferase/sulfurtransferase